MKIPVKKFGYTLWDHGTHWELHSPGQVFKGSLKQTCKHAVETLGFDIKDLEEGILTMNDYFHDCAEFGIMRKFIYSFDAYMYDILKTAN